ncbi:hypothetical protein FGADI_7574 [Fusarium gaditjirri]|uniref:Uncharacterized protein n=1 Tax=Fusarium gaditjirri TaxID=282569 RepID=A0A8H4WVH8_9HYPO|nr:hypothetical protein FGADI_7574 [Fusarium gaditjirri]
MMHLPVVTITLTLLSLYVAKIRWDNPSSELLNGLQFAAKTHEAAILMSLGDILLYRISYGLNRQDIGIPLGFLSSAFYLSGPLRYLASRQLWVPTFRYGNSAKYQLSTGAMIVFVSILCMGAGPLSAIAMIPRLDWWKDEMFNPFDKEDIADHRPVTKWIPPVKYRTRFGGESGPFVRNNIDDSIDPRDMLITANVAEEGPKTEFANCTYTNYNDINSLIAIKNEVVMTSGTRPLSFVTLGLSNASMNAFGNSYAVPWLTTSHRQALGSGSGMTWKQPLVSVGCNYSYAMGDDTVKFFFSSLNKTVRLRTNSSTALADLSYYKAADYRYPNLQKSKELPISADILFLTIEDWGPEYTLCVIFASWSDADTWIESPLSYNSLFELERPISEVTADASRDLIHMDDEWMEGIASFSDKSFFKAIANWCEGGATSWCFELRLVLHITDAIAQAGNIVSWPEYFSDAQQSDNTGKDAILYTRYYRTYAYRFSSSRGILLAFTFLLLHVLMVLAHLAEIIRSKDPWQGSDWDNFGDLFVLALASKPPDGTGDLAHQSSKSQLWVKTVTVARDGDEGRCQVRLREENGYRRANGEEEGVRVE